MKKSFLYLTIVLLAFGIALWQNNAQAQCRYLQPNGVTIVPDVTTLEIVGGNLFDGQTPLPGSNTPRTTHDVFIRLDAGNPDSLGVTIINQVTLEVQFADIAVIPFAFGFADRILNTADGGLGTVVITEGTFGPAPPGGGKLTYLYSADGGLNWDQTIVGPGNRYTNAIIINTGDNKLFSNEFAVLGLNADTNAIDAYLTVDGGHNFNPQGPVVAPPLVSPFDGGVAACGTYAAGYDGVGWYNLFYSRPNGVNNQDVILGNTMTGVWQVVDTDSRNDGIIRDGACASDTDFSAATVYNGDWNSYHATTWNNSFGQPGGDPAETTDLTPAGNINGPGQLSFRSATLCRTPPNNQSVGVGVTVGGPRPPTNGGSTFHIKIPASGNIQVFRSDPNQDPNSQDASGPKSMNQINFPNRVGNSVALNRTGNSFVYAQCIFTDPPSIPTLSEWGLIAMAGILGIVGFMVIRRMKAAA